MEHGVRSRIIYKAGCYPRIIEDRHNECRHRVILLWYPVVQALISSALMTPLKEYAIFECRYTNHTRERTLGKQ